MTNPKCTTTIQQLSSTKSVLKEGGGEDRSKIIWGYITYQPQDLQRKHVTKYQQSSIFFGDSRTIKRRKVNKSLSFLEWRTDQRLFGFYVGLSQDK